VLLLQPEGTAPRSLTPAVIALDEDLEGLVLDRGIAFARLVSGDRFTLVHVVEPPTPIFTEFSAVPAGFDPDAVNEAVTRARDHLEVIARRMRERGCDVTIHVKVASSIAREVCETADRLDAGVVVVGTHGRQGAKRLLLGSVADKIVRSATRPVLVVPMAGARRIARTRAAGARQRMKTVYAV
jgi:nucleotide-binding universal stress UspA family protein